VEWEYGIVTCIGTEAELGPTVCAYLLSGLACYRLEVCELSKNDLMLIYTIPTCCVKSDEIVFKVEKGLLRYSCLSQCLQSTFPIVILGRWAFRNH
jgi:hypothetical protein